MIVDGFAPYDPFYEPFWDFGPAWVWWGPWYSATAPYPSAVDIRPAPTGVASVELHVHPWTASLIVDGSRLGEARDFYGPAHPLWLKPGKHMVELEHAGFKTLSFELDLNKDQSYNLHCRLAKS